MEDTVFGQLHLYFGPMFSGKTTLLVNLHRMYTYIDKRVAVVNYADDVRYHETMLSTHDKTMIPCVRLSALSDAWSNTSHPDHAALMDADVILINEGQFFADIVNVVLDMVETYNKRVYISGLDADFQRKPFGKMADLIPYCDTVTKLSAMCSICKNGTSAIHSLRISEHTEQIVIGADSYKPVCRLCFRNRTQK
jgi:thymidine kinase